MQGIFVEYGITVDDDVADSAQRRVWQHDPRA